jgi:hypothetical protein
MENEIEPALTEPTTYRLVKVNFKSGNYKNFILSQSEILNLSLTTARADKLTDEEYESIILYYDSDLPEERRKLSTVIRLKEIEWIDIGDKDYTLEDLRNIDYTKFQVWQESDYFKHLKRKQNKIQSRKKIKSKIKIKPKKGRRKKDDN